MKKYIKPDTLTLDINLDVSLTNGNTPAGGPATGKGTDEWIPEEEIDDDWW